MQHQAVADQVAATHQAATHQVAATHRKVERYQQLPHYLPAISLNRVV